MTSHARVLFAVATCTLAALAIAALWPRSPAEQRAVEVARTDTPTIEPTAKLPLQAIAPATETPATGSAPEFPNRPEDALPAPVEDSQAAFMRSSFQALLDQFDGKPLEKPDWPGFDRQKLTPILMGMSVAAYLDDAGRSVPEIGDGGVRDPFSDGTTKFDCAFSYNGRRYFFMKGEFPIYDEWLVLNKKDSATQQPFGIEPEPERGFEFPEDFFVRASEWAHDALELRK